MLQTLLNGMAKMNIAILVLWRDCEKLYSEMK